MKMGQKKCIGTFFSMPVFASMLLHSVLGGLLFFSVMLERRHDTLELTESGTMDVVMLDLSIPFTENKVDLPQEDTTDRVDTIQPQPTVEPKVTTAPLAVKSLLIKPKKTVINRQKAKLPSQKANNKTNREVTKKSVSLLSSDATNHKILSIGENNAVAKTTRQQTVQSHGNPKALSRKQPQYPRRALMMNIEGRVKARYDVNSNGKVENVRIIEAKPKNTFDREIRIVMTQWYYEPKAAKDLEVTFVFSINGSVQLK